MADDKPGIGSAAPDAQVKPQYSAKDFAGDLDFATDDFDEIHASIERRRVREYLDQLRHEIGR